MSVMPGRRLGRAMLVLAWMLGLYLATRFFGVWEEAQVNPNPTPASVHSGGAIEVRLAGNAQGHFVASGTINGKPVVFLLDTGATAVAIPEQLAPSLGLARGAPQSVSTASGSATGYRTQVAQLELGDIVLREVPALLIPSFDSPVVLLGMSALKQLEFTQRDGTLVLRQFTTEKP